MGSQNFTWGSLYSYFEGFLDQKVLPESTAGWAVRVPRRCGVAALSALPLKEAYHLAGVGVADLHHDAAAHAAGPSQGVPHSPHIAPSTVELSQRPASVGASSSPDIPSACPGIAGLRGPDADGRGTCTWTVACGDYRMLLGGS